MASHTDRTCGSWTNIPQQYLIVFSWSSNAGVTHYSIINIGRRLRLKYSANGWRKWGKNSTLNSHGLVNRGKPQLLYDKARPHAARTALAKMQGLQLEAPSHPPCLLPRITIFLLLVYKKIMNISKSYHNGFLRLRTLESYASTVVG